MTTDGKRYVVDINDIQLRKEGGYRITTAQLKAQVAAALLGSGKVTVAQLNEHAQISGWGFDGMKETDTTPALERIQATLNSNTFEPGWGFDIVKHAQKVGSVSVFVYTPHGTKKWGITKEVPDELALDEAFDAVEMFRDFITIQAQHYAAFRLQEEGKQ